MGRTAVVFAAWFALLFALEWVFISSVSPAELVLAAGAATLGASGAAAVDHLERPHAGPAGRLAAALAAWPGTLLADTWRLTRLTVAGLATGRRPRGSFHEVTLRPGAGAAWAATLISATPGGCVVAAHEEDEKGADATVMTVHQLFPELSAVDRALTTPRERNRT
ncbi:hypothetical protein [Streptacidiphilus rugosus]|uniref:hypothetical protein n=1 Tax=Streptacidiphilus rugosus TaxID=405783 RepID=UPI000566E72E|nr:hypothetical protein [Streptacidiphilus rugosus]